MKTDARLDYDPHAANYAASRRPNPEVLASHPACGQRARGAACAGDRRGHRQCVVCVVRGIRATWAGPLTRDAFPSPPSIPICSSSRGLRKPCHSRMTRSIWPIRSMSCITSLTGTLRRVRLPGYCGRAGRSLIATDSAGRHCRPSAARIAFPGNSCGRAKTLSVRSSRSKRSLARAGLHVEPALHVLQLLSLDRHYRVSDAFLLVTPADFGRGLPARNRTSPRRSHPRSDRGHFALHDRARRQTRLARPQSGCGFQAQGRAIRRMVFAALSLPWCYGCCRVSEQVLSTGRE